jgi:predicted PurR-regulated permease PerM
MKTHLPTYVKIVIVLFGLTNFFFVLAVARAFLIPLSIAVLLSLLMLPVSRRLERWKFPRSLAILICMLLVIIGFGGLIYLILNQLIQFGSELPLLAQRLNTHLLNLRQFAIETFNVEADMLMGYVEDMLNNFLMSSGAFIAATATGTINLISTSFIVLIYMFFLMYYRTFFKRVTFRIFAQEQHETVGSIMGRVQGVIQNYIVGVFTVSAILAVLNSIGLLIIGIPYAVFFGIIAGLLNIIPFIGSFIGSVLPVLYAFMIRDSLWIPVIVAVQFSVVQTLESSIFTPNIVGSRVSLNPFAAIIALMVGAALWGPIGMILFIPFTAMLKVVFDEIPATRSLGILLGDPDAEKRQAEPQFYNRVMKRYRAYRKARREPVDS